MMSMIEAKLSFFQVQIEYILTSPRPSPPTEQLTQIGSKFNKRTVMFFQFTRHSLVQAWSYKAVSDLQKTDDQSQKGHNFGSWFFQAIYDDLPKYS